MEDKIIAYIEGTLSEAEQREVEQQLQTSPDWQKTYKELNILLGDLEQQPQWQPPASLEFRFHQLLAAEHRNLENKVVPTAKVIPLFRLEWKIAAAIALLIIGLGFGNLWQRNQQQQVALEQLQTEMLQTQKMLILAMLEKNSASERLKALNINTAKTNPDPQVVDAFIHTLLTDNNVNVRMKAAEALAEYEKNEYITAALIKALKIQNSPEVQITLIEILVNLEAKDAAGELQNILRKEDVLDIVKNKAAEGLEILL